MYNTELINMIKGCIKYNYNQFSANPRDIKDLEKMVKEMYLLNFDMLPKLDVIVLIRHILYFIQKTK